MDATLMKLDLLLFKIKETKVQFSNFLICFIVPAFVSYFYERNHYFPINNINQHSFPGDLNFILIVLSIFLDLLLNY